MITLLIVLSLFAFSKCVGSQQLNKNNDSVEIDLSIFDTIPLNERKFGFNIHHYSGDFTIEDVDYQEEILKIKPNILRFPGGTIANYYHWETGTLDSAILHRADRMKGLMNNLKEKNGGYIPFESFMEFCRSNEIKPLLVVNLYSGVLEETIAWANYVKENDFEIVGWELGNEIYLPSYRDKFPSGEKYIKVAQDYARAIKDVDSNFQVAVNVSPKEFRNDMTLNPITGVSNWNGKVLEADFYDTYTLHTYFRPITDKRELQGKSMINTFEILQRYSVNHWDRVKLYHEMFGERNMWLTEWNIHDKTNVFPHTFMHQLWYVYSVSRIIEYDFIDLSNYHVLASKKNGFPLFSRNRQKDIVYQPNYTLAREFGEVFEKYDFTFRFQNQGDIKVLGFGKSSENLEYLVIVNFSSASRPILINGEKVKWNFEIHSMEGVIKDNSELKLPPFSFAFARKIDENSSNK